MESRERTGSVISYEEASLRLMEKVKRNEQEQMEYELKQEDKRKISQNKNDIRLIFKAVVIGDIATVHSLLSHVNINESDEYGGSFLHHAAAAGKYPGIAQYLLECKATVDSLDHSGWTPLHIACSHQNTEVFIFSDI